MPASRSVCLALSLTLSLSLCLFRALSRDLPPEEGGQGEGEKSKEAEGPLEELELAVMARYVSEHFKRNLPLYIYILLRLPHI